MIILLNGTSSSGKSTIAKSIQKFVDQPYLHVGLDLFADTLPPSYIMYGERSHEGYQFLESPGPAVTIRMGPVAKKLANALHKSIQVLLQSGFNLIIDEVLFEEEDFQDYLEILKGYRVLFVGIILPLEVAEQRERDRKDRVVGLARGLNELVHQGKTYDLIIDSSKMTPEESAKFILQHLATPFSSKMFQNQQNK